MDLTEFLLARIAEDELVTSPFRNNAGAVKRWQADETGGKVRQIGPTEFGLPDVVSESDIHLSAEHIARWDPARVLAECDAKRRIVNAEILREVGPASHYVSPEVHAAIAGRTATQVLRLLALPFADHPDYDPEWRP